MSEKQDQHEIIALLKDLALAEGRTPSKHVFHEKTGVSHHRLTQTFGTYTTLCQAAELESYRERKITNAVFEKPVDKHLESYEPRPRKERERYTRTLFVPDTHFPFAHQPTLERIYRFAEAEKPDVIVQIGDLFDAYSHAKFPRSHNVFTPRDEQAAARKQAETFWQEIQKAAPKARRIQMLGNHDVRPLKRALEAYPEAEDWIAKMLGEMMSFPGVETIHDPRQELMLPGDVAVIHGFRSQTGQHRDQLMYNVVAGHLHLGGVSYRSLRGQTLWELNCGLAGDPEAKGLSYTPTKITNWTLGWGFLDDYGPRFIAA